jgi:hypothetical protein
VKGECGPFSRGAHNARARLTEWVHATAARNMPRDGENLSSENFRAIYFSVGWVIFELAKLDWLRLAPIAIAAKRLWKMLPQRRGQAHFAPRTAQNEPVPGGIANSNWICPLERN